MSAAAQADHASLTQGSAFVDWACVRWRLCTVATFGLFRSAAPSQSPNMDDTIRRCTVLSEAPLRRAPAATAQGRPLVGDHSEFGSGRPAAARAFCDAPPFPVSSELSKGAAKPVPMTSYQWTELKMPPKVRYGTLVQWRTK